MHVCDESVYMQRNIWKVLYQFNYNSTLAGELQVTFTILFLSFLIV